MQDMGELEKRLSEAKTRKQRKLLTEEIKYQKMMMQILDYMNKYESKVIDFKASFNRLIAEAMQKLKKAQLSECLTHLTHANDNLLKMLEIYDKQKQFEKFLVKTNKKTIKDLRKEKDHK